VRPVELREKLKINESIPDSFMISASYELRIFLICIGYLYLRVRLDEQGAKQKGNTTEHTEYFAKIVHGNLLHKSEIKQLEETIPNDLPAMSTILLNAEFNAFISIFELRVNEYSQILPLLLDKKTMTKEANHILKRTYSRVWHEGYGEAAPAADNLIAITHLLGMINALLGHIDELTSKFIPTEAMLYIMDQNEQAINAKHQRNTD
tara:strand:+ start:934 stop:1554 length:621 start_codon:yes stop_codon:yes gene_type:complete